MNKKMMIMILAVVLVGGGVYFFMFKGKGEEAVEGETAAENVWNPYSEEEMHIISLSDMILSASNGEYIVKMTTTIKFSSDDAYYKFKGFSSKEEAKIAAEEEGGHGAGEVHVTPMEIKINDVISDLMLRANENQITDKKMLKAYLVEGVNAQLGFEEPIISDMYIENYVIQ